MVAETGRIAGEAGRVAVVNGANRRQRNQTSEWSGCTRSINTHGERLQTTASPGATRGHPTHAISQCSTNHESSLPGFHRASSSAPYCSTALSSSDRGTNRTLSLARENRAAPKQDIAGDSATRPLSRTGVSDRDRRVARAAHPRAEKKVGMNAAILRPVEQSRRRATCQSSQ